MTYNYSSCILRLLKVFVPSLEKYLMKYSHLKIFRMQQSSLRDNYFVILICLINYNFLLKIIVCLMCCSKAFYPTIFHKI